MYYSSKPVGGATSNLATRQGSKRIPKPKTNKRVTRMNWPNQYNQLNKYTKLRTWFTMPWLIGI